MRTAFIGLLVVTLIVNIYYFFALDIIFVLFSGELFQKSSDLPGSLMLIAPVINSIGIVLTLFRELKK